MATLNFLQKFQNRIQVVGKDGIYGIMKENLFPINSQNCLSYSNMTSNTNQNNKRYFSHLENNNNDLNTDIINKNKYSYCYNYNTNNKGTSILKKCGTASLESSNRQYFRKNSYDQSSNKPIIVFPKMNYPLTGNNLAKSVSFVEDNHKLIDRNNNPLFQSENISGKHSSYQRNRPYNNLQIISENRFTPMSAIRNNSFSKGIIKEYDKINYNEDDVYRKKEKYSGAFIDKDGRRTNKSILINDNTLSNRYMKGIEEIKNRGSKIYQFGKGGRKEYIISDRFKGEY